MSNQELENKIKLLQYHQKVLLHIIDNNDALFDRLIVAKDLTEEDVTQYHQLCEGMSMRHEEQKAEGFVYFYPLLDEFKAEIHTRLDVKEVVDACLRQKLYVPLMKEFERYLR